MNIGDRIRDFRESAGMTQRGLAKAADISNEYIYKIEKGEMTNIGLEKLIAIANALGVDICALFSRVPMESVRKTIEKEGYIKPDRETSELIDLWDHMSDDQKQAFKAMGEAVVGKQHPKKKRANS